MMTVRTLIPTVFRATAVTLVLFSAASASASETASDGRQQPGFELPEERLAQCRKLGEGDSARINPRLIAFTNAEIMSRSVICSGRPPLSASMLAPNDDCSCEYRHS